MKYISGLEHSGRDKTSQAENLGTYQKCVYLKSVTRHNCVFLSLDNTVLIMSHSVSHYGDLPQALRNHVLQMRFLTVQLRNKTGHRLQPGHYRHIFLNVLCTLVVELP